MTRPRQVLRSRWGRRLMRVVPPWLVALTLLAVVGLSPSVPLAAAALVAGLGLLSALDPATADESDPLASHTHQWGGRRGSDQRTLALARQLARLASSRYGGEQLAHDVHARLRAVLEAHVWRTHGVDLPRHTEWAPRLLPPDLAAFYAAPPNPRDLRPDRLGPLLTRIEQL